MTKCVDMYEFNVWANLRMLERLKELPGELYRREVQSVFPTVSKAMAHIYTVELAWLNILEGCSMVDAMAMSEPYAREAENASVERLEQLMIELAGRYRAFFAGQADMEQEIELDNPYTFKRNISLAAMVLQVVNHATYHRGNVTAMLRQMGVASVMTEYALFWYQGADAGVK
jgi:uncharacterized damage-inducible protein DinB